MQMVSMSLFWIFSTSALERKARSQGTSRSRSWATKLLISPVASAMVSFLDVVCREQKKWSVIIGSMCARLSSSLADTNVVGGNISFASPSPLSNSVRDPGKFSHSRRVGERIIHSTRSWSVRLSDVPVLRQRFRSCWGTSGGESSDERRDFLVMAALNVSDDDLGEMLSYTYNIWVMNRSRAVPLISGAVLWLCLVSG